MKPTTTRVQRLKTNFRKLDRRYVHAAVAFALAFGLVVAVTSRAADLTVGSLEAEAMTLPSNGAQVVTDSGASEGKAVTLTGAAAATGTLTTTADGTSVQVVAKGANCKGPAKLTVRVDGSQLIQTSVSGSWSTYSATKSLSAGSHSVSIALANPYSWKKCSRSLTVDVTRVIGSGTPVTTSPSPSPSPSPTPTPTPTPTTGPVPGQVLWTGDMETGNLSQWCSWDGNAGHINTVTSPVAQGRYSVRFDLSDGDVGRWGGERDELGQYNFGNCNTGMSNPDENLLLDQEGDDRWVSFQVMYGSNWDPRADGWQTSAQWHPYGSTNDSYTMLGWNAEFGYMDIRQGDTMSYPSTLWKTPITRGVWHKVTFHYKWSTNPSVGFVEAWVDGQQVLPKYFRQTLGTYNGVTREDSPHIGIYRNPNMYGTETSWFDGYTVATTREAAEANAFAPAE